MSESVCVWCGAGPPGEYRARTGDCAEWCERVAEVVTATNSAGQSIVDDVYLYQRYVVDGRSSLAIGQEMGVSPQTVINSLRRFGIPVRPIGRPRRTSGV